MIRPGRVLQPFRLEPSTARPLDGFLDLPAQAGACPLPVVVVCHGFKGFMEWGFFPPLAELLAERGFAVVRFNFSGAGQRPGEDRVSDLAAFRDNTYSREQEDLGVVLDALPWIARDAGIQIDLDRVGLLGHSRGGGAAVLAAGHPERGAKIAALVTWAAIAHVDRIGDQEAKERWRREGEYVIKNGRTGQELPLGVGLLDDVEQNREALDIQGAAARVRCPWLILHGDEDGSVPVSEARTLASAALNEQPDDALLILGGAGHTFGAVHPFAGPTPHLITAMNATQSWLRRHLCKDP